MKSKFIGVKKLTLYKLYSRVDVGYKGTRRLEMKPNDNKNEKVFLSDINAKTVSGTAMKKRWGILFLLIMALLSSCASIGSVSKGGGSGAGVSLLEAVEQSADKIATNLPKGSRVAIVAFESESDNLSDFIMEELTGALVDRGIEVADRQNLAYVYKELNFQMSGDVSDETAQSVGKFLGAQMVITGQLTGLGGSYRFRASAIQVEKDTLSSVTRLMVRNDRETKNMIATLAKQKTTVKTAKYGVTETTTPQTAGTFLDRGILFASRGNYEMAIADFTEALKLNPNMGAAYSLRGRAWYASVSRVTDVGTNFSYINTISTNGKATADQTRAYDLAIADFTAALQLDPNNAHIYIERGNAYSDKGDYDRAIADYNQALRLNPNYANAYNNRGIAYKNKGDYDRAIADYNQAIKLYPYFAEAYNNRGFAYDAKGDYDRAIEDYNQAIRLNPNYAVAYNNRGNTYYNKGDYDRAIEDYNQAIRLNPNYAVAYNNRGMVYHMNKDCDRAIEDYNQAIRLNPNYTVAYNNRGSAYDAKGDYDRAIADYGEAIRLNPNYAVAYYSRGNMYYMKKDYDRAIADHSQTIKLDPNDAFSYINRGMAYHMNKDYDRAIADYEAALRINPNDANAKTLLENARKARGR
ncbi:hypothetical protein R84B8_02358 [Treponema sp. R8-4-B8]